ncbi:MAG TPA: hypothetical protein VF574_01830 [Allosphingosinicella sp.]|jgi:hypothetical protein
MSDMETNHRKTHLPRTKRTADLCTCSQASTVEEEVDEAVSFGGMLIVATAKSAPVEVGVFDGQTMYGTEVEVSEVLTGSMPDTVTLVHPLESSACGIEFEIDKEFMWWVFSDPTEQNDPTYMTDQCSEARFDIDDYKRVLGGGTNS